MTYSDIILFYMLSLVILGFFALLFQIIIDVTKNK